MPNFCREFLRPKERFDPHSFRMKIIGKKKDHRLLLACPKGSWDGERCGGAMKAVSLLHPKAEKKCPRGRDDFKTKGFPLAELLEEIGELDEKQKKMIAYVFRQGGEKLVQSMIDRMYELERKYPDTTPREARNLEKYLKVLKSSELNSTSYLDGLDPEIKDSTRYTFKRWGEKAVKEQIRKRRGYEERHPGSYPLADEVEAYLKELKRKKASGLNLGGADPGMTLTEKLTLGIFGSLLAIHTVRLIADWRAGRL